DPETVVAISRAVVEFRLRGRRTFRAVDDVSFTIGTGEIVGLVGESGSGKTTLAKAIVGLQSFHGGSVTFRGKEIVGCRGSELRNLRRGIGFVFQDPGSSLNPRRTIGDSISEPMRIAGGISSADMKRRVGEALEQVRLPAAAA